MGGIQNEIILVGAEADFDFPQLVISGDNILSVQIVCTMDQYSMEAILPGCVLDPGLVNRDIATVGERQKTVTTQLPQRRSIRLEHRNLIQVYITTQY